MQSPFRKGVTAAIVTQPVLTTCPVKAYTWHDSHRKHFLLPEMDHKVIPIGYMQFPSLPMQACCLPAVLQRPQVVWQLWSWLLGCWGPPGQMHHPGANAWSAEPLLWMAVVGRTGRLGGTAGRGTSPDLLKMTSEVQEANLDQTGENIKKVKGSQPEDQATSSQSEVSNVPLPDPEWDEINPSTSAGQNLSLTLPAYTRTDMTPAAQMLHSVWSEMPWLAIWQWCLAHQFLRYNKSQFASTHVKLCCEHFFHSDKTVHISESSAVFQVQEISLQLITSIVILSNYYPPGKHAKGIAKKLRG